MSAFAYGHIPCAVAAPTTSRLSDRLRGAGYTVHCEDSTGGDVELGGGVFMGYTTTRQRAVETVLLDSGG